MKIHKTLGDRFAANLAAERTARKISQEQMAKLLGVSRVCVFYWESKERAPSFEVVEKIAKKLHKQPIDLLR